MAWADVLASDAAAVFCNPNEFGEEITYTPHGGSGTTVRAAITRRPELFISSLEVPADDLEISVPNDATYGVTSVKRGFDTVSFPAIIGGTAQTWRVMEIVHNDHGMWRLRVRGGL